MRTKWFSLLVAMLCTALPVLASGGGEGAHHGIDWVDFTAKVVNFLIFFGILGYFLKKPLSQFFNDRVLKIKEDLEAAKNSREEAKRRLDEIDARMASLDQELAAIEQQARQEAENEKKKMHDLAKLEAERIVEQAKMDIENMRRDAMTDLRGFIANLAIQEAESTIKKSLKPEDKNKLFLEFTQKLGS